MRRALHSAAGALILAAVVVIPSRPVMADGIRNQQWYLDSLKVSRAQEISTGAGVTVAVVDTGVYPHRDLKANLLTGYNIVTARPDGRTDTNGHGTRMAGIIAAPGRGDSGVRGIAPGAKILPIKASDTGGFVGDSVAQGINYAVSHKAQVINVSIQAAPSINLLKAIKAATEADIVVVGGAGNDGGTLVGYPASAPGALGVGATDRHGNHWSDSTRGPSLQICAPGVDIVSTGLHDKYTTAEGTSDSTAIVSGAVALVRAKFPQLSAAEVIHRIAATADDNGPPGRDDDCGFGELNIVKALTADVPPLSGGGSAGASASPSGSAAGPAPASSGGAAAPAAAADKGSSAPLVVGVVVVVLLVAGLGAFVVVRRQRRA